MNTVYIKEDVGSTAPSLHRITFESLIILFSLHTMRRASNMLPVYHFYYVHVRVITIMFGILVPVTYKCQKYFKRYFRI